MHYTNAKFPKKKKGKDTRLLALHSIIYVVCSSTRRKFLIKPYKYVQSVLVKNLMCMKF